MPDKVCYIKHFSVLFLIKGNVVLEKGDQFKGVEITDEAKEVFLTYLHGHGPHPGVKFDLVVDFFEYTENDWPLKDIILDENGNDIFGDISEDHMREVIYIDVDTYDLIKDKYYNNFATKTEFEFDEDYYDIDAFLFVEIIDTKLAHDSEGNLLKTEDNLYYTEKYFDFDQNVIQGYLDSLLDEDLADKGMRRDDWDKEMGVREYENEETGYIIKGVEIIIERTPSSTPNIVPNPNTGI
jgi:hypothetical protein